MLRKLIDKKVLILDGAMGTMIQKYPLCEDDFRGKAFTDVPGLMKGNNDILNLTRPDIIEDIHRKYLLAGADIIETNTFSSQRISQEDYKVAEFAREITEAGCRIARKVADEFTATDPRKPRFVAGSVGPTNKSCSISPDVSDPALRNITFDALAESYTEQMSAMIDCGVDAILIETIFDTLNAKAAIYAAEEAMKACGRKVPLMLSATIADTTGRTLSGQTLEAFVASISHADIFSIGLNCSFGADMLLPYIKQLADNTPYYISVHPNAGLPNSLGEYDQTPEAMAEQISKYLSDGLVNIIGGCCGTTDKHIALYNDMIGTGDTCVQPHKPAPQAATMTLAGLEPFRMQQNCLVRIGERCNVAGSRKFLRLIKEHKYDEALTIARKQVDSGAQIIDLNMDDALLDTKSEMCHFVNLLMSDPDIAKVPLMIDSSDWDTIRASLKCVQGKCIVNSISLKEGEETFIRHAKEIKRHGAAVVVMAFDEKGQATTLERRIEICERSYRLLTQKAQFNPSDIIFDPNVLTIATGMDEHRTYAKDFILATEWIRQNLPHSHVSGGISNLSFAFRGNNYLREAIHTVFLHHAEKAGLDFAIVNPSEVMTCDDISPELLNAIEDVIFDRNTNATEKLVSMADSTCGASKPSSQQTTDNIRRENTSVSERLIEALVKGNPEHLQQDIAEAVSANHSPVDIISGPLMTAMEQVGTLFGEGKMFLPQVVKSARTMKQAVSLLQPLIKNTAGNDTHTNTHQPKVLLATVKGDVHDIGKNIVSVILSCNNYHVIDLGVMVPAEEIVARAIEEKADIIGLSGLITPSLEEMVNVARLLEEKGLKTPLMIGGATTSHLHTSLKIAPAYSAPTVWMSDASQNVIAASQLLNPHTRDNYIATIRTQQEEARKSMSTSCHTPLTMEQARGKTPPIDFAHN